MRPGLLSELVNIGYEILLEGENIRLRYRKEDAPPEAARSLINELKMYKAEVLDMLKISNNTVTSKSVADTMDEILRQTIAEIDAGWVWNLTAKVREIETKIDSCYRDVLSGSKPLDDFIDVCLQWKRAGTRELRKEHPDNPTDTWDEPTAVLIRWFMGATLPQESFSVSPWEHVLHPEKYDEFLKREIKAGPKTIRARYGALQGDLQRLRDYSERRADT